MIAGGVSWDEVIAPVIDHISPLMGIVVWVLDSEVGVQKKTGKNPEHVPQICQASMFWNSASTQVDLE